MACRKNSIFFSKSNQSPGFTMVETLVAIGILGIFFAAIAMIIQNVIENVGASRVRTTALALGQEKMETIRNLPYTNVGTVGGIPTGPILQNETVTINNLAFTVKTSIIYIDDPFDFVAPTDILPADYKRARVEITWAGAFPSRMPIVLVTNIAPKGLESVVGGGSLIINVSDSQGQPISNATINIDNTMITPQIHMQTLSDSYGTVAIPGAPSCIRCYQISVTKTNYSTDKTYSTAEVTNPLQPYATIIDGRITQLSFSIDQISTVIVNSVNISYQPIANVMFTLKGNKIIGHDTSDNPVYKYSYATNTGGSTVSIPALEWDNYSLDFSNSAHTLAGSNPTIPFALLPNTSQTITIVAVPKAAASLQLTVKNSSGILQSSASATLSSIPLGYSVNKITPATSSADYGQVLFNNLSIGNYNLDVTLPGFTEATASVSITGNMQEIITLNNY
jgi:prepilin-type N-terminal cleavage/methylation domain-containing protein